jgi:tetratricopeptide (TPR) repeat protein
MQRSSLFLTAALVGATVALTQPVAAKSAAEVQSIARAATVEIKLQQQGSVGSGVIIDRTENLYTLVTNRHVVCGNRLCSKLPATESYNLSLADGQQQQVNKSNIKLLGNDLDLAIIQFRSNRNYAVAKIASLASLKTKDIVYTAGFPAEEPGFTFGEGDAIAVVNKRLNGDSGGYTVIYNAPTLPGMSGSGVFDLNGQLVAIHGQGDRYKENTDIDDKSRTGSKIGINRGIPMRWLVKNLAEIGIKVGTDNSIYTSKDTSSKVPTSADEYFITGFNKFVDPGDNIAAGKQQAIQDFIAAIRLNPNYQYAYFVRALAYEQVQDFSQSLSDFNQAILLDPKYSTAYNNRAILKYKMNDNQGSLADFNQAILLSPKYFLAYNNRGLLKHLRLDDSQGALADYNQAIVIKPKYFLAYNNRANLKYLKLNDNQGALDDYNQAIVINPKYFEAYYNRAILKTEKLNDIQGAIADYNQAIINNPRYAEAYNNRGVLKDNKLNDTEGALADYNQAIINNPKYAEAYNNRGTLKTDKLNDIQGALADYNQAIVANSQYFEAYFNRANLKTNKLSDHQGALTDYNQAILINPKYSSAYNNRAILKHFKLNDIQGALVDYSQAISTNPKSAEAHANRGILKAYKLNDRAGAIEDFRQAARLFREQGNNNGLQMALKDLSRLGATE